MTRTRLVAAALVAALAAPARAQGDAPSSPPHPETRNAAKMVEIIEVDRMTCSLVPDHWSNNASTKPFGSKS